MGKAGTRLGSRMAWSRWSCLALKRFALAGATGTQLVVPTLPRLRFLVSSFLKGSERLSLRNIYSVAINKHTGRRVKNTRQWWKLSLRRDERWIADDHWWWEEEGEQAGSWDQQHYCINIIHPLRPDSRFLVPYCLVWLDVRDLLHHKVSLN